MIDSRANGFRRRKVSEMQNTNDSLLLDFRRRRTEPLRLAPFGLAFWSFQHVHSDRARTVPKNSRRDERRRAWQDWQRLLGLLVLR